MADYIDKDILCQAYIHVEPEFLASDGYSQFADQLKKFAVDRAKFFLYSDVEVQIEFEEGSLKARVTVFGVLALLMQGVANYKDFKESAALMYDDVRRFSEMLVSEGLFESRAKHDQIVRTEARTGVVGSLKKIVVDLESLKKHESLKSEGWARNRIAAIQESTELLLARLKTEEDRAAVKSGLLALADELPNSPSRTPKRIPSGEYIEWWRDQRNKLRKKLKASQKQDS